MFIKKKLIGACIAGALGLGSSAAVNAAVVPAYFGMNYVSSNYSSWAPVVELLAITYQGGSGPAMAGIPTLPDKVGLVANPTYLTVANGDGESTRNLGGPGFAVPIDWDTTNPIYQITITGIHVNVPGYGVFAASGNYSVSLIDPNAPWFSPGATELNSGSAMLDIYTAPVGAFTATATPPGLESLIGDAFGGFTFAAAAPVPVPAAAWLFGSGLLGLAGVARRKAGRSK